MMLSLVNAVCVPLSLSFEPKALETSTFQNLNFGIDFFFFIDIFISFRTVYVDDLGNEYEDPKIITREYLRGQFAIDLLATLPLDVLFDLTT